MLSDREAGEPSKEEDSLENELASVKIDHEQVSIIMEEMEVDKEHAERALREHRGDVVAALESMVNA